MSGSDAASLSSGVFCDSPHDNVPFSHDETAKHSALLRQQSVEELERQDTPPSDRASPMLSPPTAATKKAKKEKKKFSIFRRSSHSHSHKKEKSPAPDTDFPDSSASSTLHLPGNGSPQLVHRSPSLSGESLSESGGHADSDEDFVESLVHPKGRSTPSLYPTQHLTVPSPMQLADTLSLDTDDEAASSQLQYTVQVTLHSGHNLAIRDRTGSSDPYVKFKCGRFRYRSSIVHRNLNPEWNESFEFKTFDLSKPLRVKVYDHDFGSLDDYMGGSHIDLSTYLRGELDIVDLGLDDPNAKEDSLGFLRLFIQVSSNSSELESVAKSAKEMQRMRRQRSCQLWKSVLTVSLLEGTGLPAMDDNGKSDPYVKFKLGSQKYKSKVRTKTLNPVWKEQFEFRMYDGDPTLLHIEVWDRDYAQSDDYMGGCSLNIGALQSEMTHDLTLPLEPANCGSIHFLLTVSGSSIIAEEELTRGESQTISMEEMRNKYKLLKTANMKAIKNKEIGFLQVKVEKADLHEVDHGGASNPFVIVEVCNQRVRTHTVMKSAVPEWGKTFYFNIRDIHDTLDLSVFSEDKGKSGKAELLGRISVPLLRLEPGVCKPYALKDKRCIHRAKGVVYIECDLVYNPIRACIRTINPREDKLLDEEQKLKWKLLVNNVKRVAELVSTIMGIWETIKGFWTWKNKAQSLLAFCIFLLAAWFGELWMLFFVLALVFLYQYLVVYIRGKHDWQLKLKRIASTDSDFLTDSSDLSELEDGMEEEDSKETHKNWRARLRQIQGVLVIVQNVLGYLADLGERIKNVFQWSVPLLCWMAICLLLGAGAVLYYIPLRYIILLWGINKFTKRLRKPNYIDNNELLDYLSRSPCDRELLQWQELTVHSTPEHGRNRKKTKRKR